MGLMSDGYGVRELLPSPVLKAWPSHLWCWRVTVMVLESDSYGVDE
jgi:hypothetical protein